MGSGYSNNLCNDLRRISSKVFPDNKITNSIIVGAYKYWYESNSKKIIHNSLNKTECFLELFNIVSSRVGTPIFFLRVPSSFCNKFKKLPFSFWEPSKLVYVNCMKHFKMKVLRFVLYKSIENIIIITLYTFRLNSVFTTDICFG